MQWNAVVAMRYSGLCPCCQSKKIVDRYGNPISGVYEADHWKGRGSNKIGDGWPVCRDCNHGVLETDRLSRVAAFQQFHSLRRTLFPSANLDCQQLALAIGEAETA